MTVMTEQGDYLRNVVLVGTAVGAALLLIGMGLYQSYLGRKKKR